MYVDKISWISVGGYMYFHLINNDLLYVNFTRKVFPNITRMILHVVSVNSKQLSANRSCHMFTKESF